MQEMHILDLQKKRQITLNFIQQKDIAIGVAIQLVCLYLLLLSEIFPLVPWALYFMSLQI